MSAGLSLDEGFRALQIFDHVPADHIGVLVTGHDFEPHLRQGELAIVDADDKSPQFGELYALRMNMTSPARLQHLAIIQLIREVAITGGETGFYYAFGLAGTGPMLLGQRRRYVDGPTSLAYWETKCAGRIVGAMKPMWEGRS